MKGKVSHKGRKGHKGKNVTGPGLTLLAAAELAIVWFEEFRRTDLPHGVFSPEMLFRGGFAFASLSKAIEGAKEKPRVRIV